MVGAIILGLVAGAIARLLVPRDIFQGKGGPVSWLIFLVLGLAGAYLGWLLFTKGFNIGDDDIFDLGGILGAIVGAVILLAGLLVVQGTLGTVMAIAALIPISGGIFDFCLVGFAMGYPLNGGAARKKLEGK